MVNFALDHFKLHLKDSRRKDADGSGSDEEEEDEESEEESEEEEEAEEADKSELSRAERKELKKKQAAEKMKQKQKQAGGGGDDDSEDDSDLINPNHVKSKMNISDLSAPRELSRKEREAKDKKEAQDKYWKVRALCPVQCIFWLNSYSLSHSSYMSQERLTRRKLTFHV